MRTANETVLSRTRAIGVGLALGAAVISGVAVFTNSYGVKAFGNPLVYTTAKNMVAAAVLLVLLVVATRRGLPDGFTRPQTRGQWTGLGIVAIVGGSVPFVLFFEGLARSSSVQAAFLQKTLVIWVLLLAVPLLHERVGPWHVAAIGLLVWGQALLGGGVRGIGLGSGEAMILAATLLWSVEIVVAKKLLASLSALTVATARMGLGVIVLIAWTLATTSWSELASVGAHQWAWALLTGLILAAYVATWYAALSLAPAVDVTALLVFGAIVTALLQAGVQAVPPATGTGGLLLIAAGTILVAAVTLRQEPRVRQAPGIGASP